LSVCFWLPAQIRTSATGKHNGDAIGWAEHFRRPEIVQMLEAHAGKP
jgi:hypothetical protein